MKHKPRLVIAAVCGQQLCVDGQPHDDLKRVVLRDETGRAIGGSVACSRCESLAINRDVLGS